MTGRDDLEKLFEAALHETEAPSRFGTPDSLKKSAPAAFRKAAPPFQAAPAPQAPPPAAFVAAPPPTTAAAQPAVLRDKQGDASLDTAINSELAEIMDAKIVREKSRRRRGRLVLVLCLLGASGGAAGWVAVNPERVEAMKQTLAEIKSAGDIKGMVEKYQVALDKIGERGKQIDAATTAMGIDPASVNEHEDPGFDKEMREMMGEQGGKTTAARDKVLREKFGDVTETGSLIKNKDETAAEKEQ